MSLNWVTQSTKFTRFPFTPTGLPVFLPLCQPGTHLLWLHRWNSSHLPCPQLALPRQPAQATLPRGGCGPGLGAQVLPSSGRQRGPARVCLLISIHAFWSTCIMASPGREAGYSYSGAAKSLPPEVFSLVRKLSDKYTNKIISDSRKYFGEIKQGPRQKSV